MRSLQTGDGRLQVTSPNPPRRPARGLFPAYLRQPPVCAAPSEAGPGTGEPGATEAPTPPNLKQDLRAGQGSGGSPTTKGKSWCLWVGISSGACSGTWEKNPPSEYLTRGRRGGEHAGTARGQAGGGAAARCSPGGGVLPGRPRALRPPPARPASRPSPHVPSPTALSLSFFPGSARPHPAAPARRLAQWPWCRDGASADPPGLRASGNQSGRRGRPRPPIKRAGRRAALQSREWEKSQLSKQHLPVLLASLLLTSLSPPARPAALLGA